MSEGAKRPSESVGEVCGAVLCRAVYRFLAD